LADGGDTQRFSSGNVKRCTDPAASLLHLGDRARKDSVERGRPFAHSVRAALEV